MEDIPECKLAANTVLSLSDIDTLNSSSLASIKVKDLDGNVRTLTRDIEDDGLSLDDIFTIFDIWVGNLKGLDVYDKEFDLTNRVLYPFDKRVLDIIDSDLDSVIHRVKKAYSEKVHLPIFRSILLAMIRILRLMHLLIRYALQI